MTAERWDTVVGLETHVQLRTRTKMFCGCENVYGAPPNTHTCPVCAGLPGALPVANRRAFELAIRAGLALGCEIAPHVKFDRKQYFYPDLPKGYQISQFDLPINHSGRLELASGRSVGIVRAHLEEDAGKNAHGDDDRGTLVDLNRCGIPLLEIVTAPDMDGPDAAYEYLTTLKLLLRTIGVSDCDMEKGSLRCDVNISLKPKGASKLGTKIELKNLNSFKMVRRAIAFEQERQAAILEAGGAIAVEETRTWDDVAGESRLMRSKEGSADYRYFPDPDLSPFTMDRAMIEAVARDLPELPAARERRFMDELGLTAYDAALLVQDREVADWFERLATLTGDPKKAANWTGAEVFQALNESGRSIGELGLAPEVVAELIAMTRDGTLSHVGAQKTFRAILAEGGEPREKAAALGLVQVSDESALEGIVRKVMDANPKAVEDLRGGKKKAIGAILGQVMRETKGAANPATVTAIVERLTAG